MILAIHRHIGERRAAEAVPAVSVDGLRVTLVYASPAAHAARVVQAAAFYHLSGHIQPDQDEQRRHHDRRGRAPRGRDRARGHQRERQRLEAAMNEELAAVRARHEAEAAPHTAAIDGLSHAVEVWADANRALLTRHGRTRSAKLASGDIGWRLSPPAVEVEGEAAVLEELQRRGLQRFVRVRESLNQEAHREQIRRPEVHGPLHELRTEHAGEHAARHRRPRRQPGTGPRQLVTVLSRSDVNELLAPIPGGDPAGSDASLNGALGLALPMSDPQNGQLNPLGINCLRSMVPAGRIAWGARTRQGDDRLASEWKYLPVRRLALYIEESLYRGTQWVVFEPNDEPLWAQIRLNVGAFMHTLFRQGAFQGSTPA